MKIRELKQILRRRGYQVRPGRGSHSIWSSPLGQARPIVISGSDSDDAHPYQIARVCRGKQTNRHACKNIRRKD